MASSAKIIVTAAGRPAVKRIIADSSEDDTPVSKRSRPADAAPPSSSALTESDDDRPLAASSQLKRASESSSSLTLTTDSAKPRPAARARKPKDEQLSSDDEPIASKTKPPPAKKPRKAKIEESEEPKPAKKPRQTKAKAKAGEVDEKPDISLSNNKPVKAKSKQNLKSNASGSKKKNGAVKKEEVGTEEEAEDDEYKWWEQTKDDDTKKWDTLQHNGVLFPPEYVELPKHVKMKYDGKPVDLSPEAEEVAGFFGAMLNSDHCQKPTFCQNFFNDFCSVLKDYPPRDGTKIKEFSKCDFKPILEYYEGEREKKKLLTKDEKAALKAEKTLLEQKYQFCLLDGRQEKVGNFRVEPPSLFRGRGEHPKTGRLKKRIQPEDITINCSANVPIPEPPPGHQWGAVVHLDKASWLAFWKENINQATKYVFLAPGSSLKGQSDMKKFEKARMLKGHIDRIRADYTKELTDKAMVVRQRATAMYLIDKFALRAGNEKGDDEADTVGCCSLRYEHLTLQPPATVTFDFLGKDSIRFYNTFEVDQQVFKNLMIFKKDPKGVGDMIFDRISTGTLNKHLSDLMPGLSAKVFRTYNASITFERELAKNMIQYKGNPSDMDKLYAYNKANRQVAVLCNHQKAVSKGHQGSMIKAREKIRAMKYQRRRLRFQLFKASGFEKKKFKEYLVEESDLDVDWMEEHEKDLEAKEIERLTKKFEKDKEKLAEGVKKEDVETETETQNNNSPTKNNNNKKKTNTLLDENTLKIKIEEVEGLAERLAKERIEGIGGNESNSNKQADQIVNAIKKIDFRIENSKTMVKDRDEGKETSLGTSKTNYIDPRLTYAWCAKYDVDVAKMFPKTLREKFTWAAATPADWTF